MTENQNNTPEILLGKIENLEQEIKDKNDIIVKYERNIKNFKEMEENYKNVRKNEEQILAEKQPVSLGISESEKISYQKQIISLEHQIFDSKKIIEKLQSANSMRHS